MNETGADRTRLLLLELLDALLGSWWTVVVGLALGLAGGLVVLEKTDKIYDAYTVVDIDVEALPDAFVTKTVVEEDGMLLHRVLRNVLNSEQLENRIRALAERSDAAAIEDDLVARVRGQTSLTFYDINRPIEIHFYYGDPVIAAGVANVVTRLFVEVTAETRSGTARETVETMQRLADEAKRDLEEQQAEISAYRSAHIDELPERILQVQSSLAQKRTELATNQEVQSTFLARIQTLEAQAATGASPESALAWDGDPDAGAVATPLAGTELSRLKATRDELLLSFQPSHPEVRRIQALIDELESREPATERPADVAPEEPALDEPAFGVWDLQLRAARAKLRKLEDEEQEIRREIARLETRQRNIPLVQQELDRLSWGLSAKQREFDQLQAKVLTAKSGERLENLEGDRRFSINHLAAIPAVPVSPKPALLLGGGCMIGLGLFVGPVIARRFLAPKVSSEAAVHTLVDVPVIGRIPSIPTGANRRARKVRIWKNVSLATSGALILGVVLTLQLTGIL